MPARALRDPAGRCRDRRRRDRGDPARRPAPSASGKTTTIVQQAPLTSAAPASESRAGGLTARDIYRRAAPGVVFVRARSVQQTQSPFDVFPRQQENVATGSGFVLDDKGHILTNAHVVASSTDVRVSFSDHRTVSARVIGKDADTDLAVLAREPQGRRAAPARARRLLRRPGRRPDGGDRQPVRARAHAHHRRRLGAAAAHHRAERVRDRGRHPDRRGAQPRQLRRPAARRHRPRDRRQLADRHRRRLVAAASASASRSRPPRSSSVLPELEKAGRVRRAVPRRPRPRGRAAACWSRPSRPARPRRRRASAAATTRRSTSATAASSCSAATC